MGKTRPAYERYCHVCWLGGRCWRIALTGSFQSASNWANIVGTGVLAFGLQHFGRQLMPAESWSEIVAQGLFYIIVAWLVIFLARLILVAPFIIYREGTWYGSKFVYRESKLAFHVFVSPAENNRVFEFRYRDAPPFCLIDYRIELDGRPEFISVCVSSHPRQLPKFQTHDDLRYSRGAIRVGRKRDLCMSTFMRGDATPFSVRIYVTGWEVGPGGDPPPPRSDPPPLTYWA
jgi:hypothetical protein